MIIYKLIIILIFIVILIMILFLRDKKNVQIVDLENTTREFEEIFEKLNSIDMEKLEKAEENVKDTEDTKKICLILFACCIVPMLFLEIEYTIGIILSFCFVYFVAYLLIIGSKMNYRKTYKENLIPAFVKLVNHNLNYIVVDYLKNLSLYNDKTYLKYQRIYTESGFDSRNPYEIYLEDFIEGNLNENIFLEMCDVQTSKINNDGNFQGIFACITLNKNIYTTIKILRYLKSIDDIQKKVKMDSSEFERYFYIASENEILAMKLLTHSVMEKLIEFYKNNIEYEIILSNNKIYLRFFVQSMLDPKSFKNYMDKKVFFEYYSILKFIMEISEEIYNIVQELNLD